MKKLLKHLRRLKMKPTTVGIFQKYAYNFEDVAYKKKFFLMKNIKHNRENDKFKTLIPSLLDDTYWMI